MTRNVAVDMQCHKIRCFILITSIVFATSGAVLVQEIDRSSRQSLRYCPAILQLKRSIRKHSSASSKFYQPRTGVEETNEQKLQLPQANLLAELDPPNKKRQPLDLFCSLIQGRLLEVLTWY